jgi:hypothetical protein
MSVEADDRIAIENGVLGDHHSHNLNALRITRGVDCLERDGAKFGNPAGPGLEQEGLRHAELVCGLLQARGVKVGAPVLHECVDGKRLSSRREEPGLLACLGVDEGCSSGSGGGTASVGEESC